jgi:hypothetical protein
VSYDSIPFEISQICLEILTLYQNGEDETRVQNFYDNYVKDKEYIWIQHRLRAVRTAFRLKHLSRIRSQIEQSALYIVKSTTAESPEIKADWYIDIARAVLPVSREDAAVYFNYAIKAVSRFGDEALERWSAVIALADKAAGSGHVTHETAYRFIRCAELVGENVREKYFDRDGAIKVCARLSPVSAFAAISRWRDRGVGNFDEQLRALAYEAVSSKFLYPSVGWALSTFFSGSKIEGFASLCISEEPSPILRQYILKDSIRHLRLHEASEISWRKLKQIAQACSIEDKELDEILDYYDENPEEDKKIDQLSVPVDSKDRINWDEIFCGLELTSHSGISQAIERVRATKTYFSHRDMFWTELFSHIDENDANIFLNALVTAENTDVYDLQHALSTIPDHWRKKVSVIENWPNTFKTVGQRFALNFASYGIKHFLNDIPHGEKEAEFLRKGVITRISDIEDLMNASEFFGFVNIATSLVTSEQAIDLLVFGLDRFERHIDEPEEFADGLWSKWLLPPDNMYMAFSGFIWSALGSPKAETRWKAAHCVRKLSEAGCDAEIDALICWLRKDTVDAFGSYKFPFYNLHSRLYLLIALARVSIDFPEKLQHHHEVFSFHALGNNKHILLNKFAAEIALNFEKAFPNTYTKDVVNQLQQIGISQLPIKKINSYNPQITSYWHKNGEVDKSLKFDHSYDFDRYWFEPLGSVFGISGQQVEDLATEVIVKELGVKNDVGYSHDPRHGLWQSGARGRETWHDHGTYPLVDDYSFYISYHSMFVVAAKLLEKMPVIKRDWDEDEWLGWLHRHTLTRNDGGWLADRRDPAPLRRPAWIREDKTKEWRLEITTEDFHKAVFVDGKGETWLNVSGWWDESDNDRIEHISVYSALVCPDAIRSLLNALSTCPNPHDFKLPEHGEERMEFESHPFVLKGWIRSQNKDAGLDDYDPLAGKIYYPPYQVGHEIIERLGLLVDFEQRTWSLPGSGDIVMRCNIWSTGKSRQDEDPIRRGNRLSASLGFLTKLCRAMKFELILEVQISRRFKQNSYLREKDEDGYKPPRSQIYILSAEGELRDATTHYQLR